jgi:hypothetical protein
MFEKHVLDGVKIGIKRLTICLNVGFLFVSSKELKIFSISI